MFALSMPHTSLVIQAASILLLIGRAACQQTIVAAPNCSLSSWNWTTNALGHNVCQQAGLALSPCAAPGLINIPTLQPPVATGEYNGPSADQGTTGNMCQCNSVFYSLISACAGCQGGLWEPYPVWIFNCTNSAPIGTWPSEQVGFPSGADIPAWAFQPLSASTQTFDNRSAFAFAQTNRTEVTSLPGPTSTAASTTASTSTTNDPITASNTSSPSPGSKSNAGAIAGGVVGGVVGVALLVALGWWLLRRRHSSIPTQELHSEGVMAESSFVGGGSAMPHAPQRFYDPSDPSTFPDRLGAGGSVGPSSTSPDPTINTTHHQAGHKPMSSWGSGDTGVYRGLPEV